VSHLSPAWSFLFNHTSFLLEQAKPSFVLDLWAIAVLFWSKCSSSNVNSWLFLFFWILDKISCSQSLLFYQLI
jgi:hypothetical protein